MLGLALIVIGGILLAAGVIARDWIFGLIAFVVLVAAVFDLVTGKLSGPRAKWK
jgi:hypothetical protein